MTYQERVAEISTKVRLAMNLQRDEKADLQRLFLDFYMVLQLLLQWEGPAFDGTNITNFLWMIFL